MYNVTLCPYRVRQTTTETTIYKNARVLLYRHPSSPFVSSVSASRLQHKLLLKSLQALAIPRVLNLAGIRGLASSGARVAVTTALRPTRLLRASRGTGGRLGRLGSRRRRGLGGSGGRLTGRGGRNRGPEGRVHSRRGVGVLGRSRGFRRRSGQDGADSGIGGLLVEVAIKDRSVTVLDPVVLVDEAPDGDTDAAVDVHAGANHVSIVGSLLGLDGGGGGLVLVRNVELGIGNLNTESCEALEEVGHGSARGRAADSHMGLETDTINGGAGSLDELDELKGPFGLGAVVLEVVVVVVAGRC